MTVKSALLIAGAVALIITAGLIMGATMLPAVPPAVPTPIPTLKPMSADISHQASALAQSDGEPELLPTLPPVTTLPPISNIPPTRNNQRPPTPTPFNARAVLTGRKIGIDPMDEGVSGEIALSVALKLRALLQSSGATVVMTHESTDPELTNLQRAQRMNDSNADIVIRLSCNDDSDDALAGIMALVPSGAETTEIQARSRLAAETVLQALTAAARAGSRGLRGMEDREGYNWFNMPVFGIKLGYLSNADERLLLQDAAHQDRCVDGIIKGLADYFG